MANHFSRTVKEIISFSMQEAIRLGNDHIDTAHLLLALIREGENDAVRVLKSYSIDVAGLQKKVEETIADKTGKQKHISRLPLTRDAEEVVRQMVTEAKTLRHPQITAQDLMLSILKNEKNIAGQILNQYHVGYDSYKSKVVGV